MSLDGGHDGPLVAMTGRCGCRCQILKHTSYRVGRSMPVRWVLPLVEEGLDQQGVPASSAFGGGVRLATCRPRWCPGWVGGVVALWVGARTRLPRSWDGFGTPGLASPEAPPSARTWALAWEEGGSKTWLRPRVSLETRLSVVHHNQEVTTFAGWCSRGNDEVQPVAQAAPPLIASASIWSSWS